MVEPASNLIIGWDIKSYIDDEVKVHLANCVIDTLDLSMAYEIKLILTKLNLDMAIYRNSGSNNALGIY